MLTLLPAAGIAGSKAVRLLQGEIGSETDYDSSVDATRDWVRTGAEWIHLVDFDAAFGRSSNHELLAHIASGIDIKVELSEGTRDNASLARTLAVGAAQISLDTAALKDSEWTEWVIAEHGGKITVGFGVRGSTLTAHGWTREGGDLWKTLKRLDTAGCTYYAVTDITRGDTLSDSNAELFTEVCQRSSAPVIAFGGIAHLDDLVVLRRLVPLGLRDAIVSKALYNGNFTLQETLAVTGNGDKG